MPLELKLVICRFDIDDHALAHPLGLMLPQAQDFEPAFGQNLGHHGNHLAGADIECNDQVFDVTGHSLVFTSWKIWYQDPQPAPA
jgi:hypothetical protein